MIQGERKLARIIEALTMFFFGLGADRIQSDIALSVDQAVIRFRANYQKEYRQQLCRLEECFNEPKNRGIEDFYWEMAGSGDPGEDSQLLLVGMMIDKAEIAVEEEEVSLILYKNMGDDL